MKVCTKFKDRLIGNMFKKNIQDMCFPKCNSIHTFFMFKPIDVFSASITKSDGTVTSLLTVGTDGAITMNTTATATFYGIIVYITAN